MNSARRALATFRESEFPDPSLLDTCVHHVHKAGARRQHKCRVLIAAFFMQAMFGQQVSGNKQEAIQRTLQTRNKAQDVWSDGANSGVYDVLLFLLNMTNLQVYDRPVADVESDASASSNMGAFDLAKE